MELARQFIRDNNGRLLLSMKLLRGRGWKSADVVTRAKRDLIAAGLVHETVMGHRPNKASWYAVTWLPLNRLIGYDTGAVETFKRSAYRDSPTFQAQLSRDEIFEKWKSTGDKVAKPSAEKDELRIDGLIPAPGVDSATAAPSGGIGVIDVVPAHGTIKVLLPMTPAPSHGNHLEKPSAAVESVQH
jgi:hypothetical protein